MCKVKSFSTKTFLNPKDKINYQLTVLVKILSQPSSVPQQKKNKKKTDFTDYLKNTKERSLHSSVCLDNFELGPEKLD